MTIRLTQHWTDSDGVAHLPGAVLDLGPDLERDLVRAKFAVAIPVEMVSEAGPKLVVPTRTRRRKGVEE